MFWQGVQRNSDNEADYVERLILDILKSVTDNEVVIFDTTNKYRSNNEFTVKVRSSFLTAFHKRNLSKIQDSLQTVFKHVQGLSHTAEKVAIYYNAHLSWVIEDVGDDQLEISISFSSQAGIKEK